VTDRISHLIVGLDHDVREDDIDAIVVALSMVRGVLDVRPQVADYHQHLAEARVRAEVKMRLIKAVSDALGE
jgi:hypothetical protein